MTQQLLTQATPQTPSSQAKLASPFFPLSALSALSALKTAALSAFVSLLCINPALAQALGGLNKATDAATTIKTGMYALIGMVAIIYMIYLGAMAFTEKKSWSDFGWGVIHVSAVGGSMALAGWAWTLFA